MLKIFKLAFARRLKMQRGFNVKYVLFFKVKLQLALCKKTYLCFDHYRWRRDANNANAHLYALQCNGAIRSKVHLLTSILRLVEAQVCDRQNVLRSARWIAVYKLRDTGTCVQRLDVVEFKNAIWIQIRIAHGRTCGFLDNDVWTFSIATYLYNITAIKSKVPISRKCEANGSFVLDGRFRLLQK